MSRMGRVLYRKIREVTLPAHTAPIPERPCVAITMRSISRFATVSSRTRIGSPRPTSTDIFVFTPSSRSLAPTLSRYVAAWAASASRRAAAADGINFIAAPRSPDTVATVGTTHIRSTSVSKARATADAAARAVSAIPLPSSGTTRRRHEKGAFRPSADGWISKTGIVPHRKTCCATRPKRNPRRPLHPWVHSITRSAPISAAPSAILLATSAPSRRTWKSGLTPLESNHSATSLR